MKNVKAVTKTKEEKDRCIRENKIVLDYAYYVCGGFFLKPQLTSIISNILKIPPAKIKNMIGELQSKGLLIQKQATTTKARLYVMTNYAVACYTGTTSQNATSVKLNPQKIWLNLFRQEYIIREILPKVVGKVHNHRELLKWMEERFVDIYRVQNQEKIYFLYHQFYQKFPVLNKKSDKVLPQGEFTNDYLAAAAEYHDYLLHFLKNSEKAEKYKGYEGFKEKKQLNTALFDKEEEKNKNCFQFSQMIGQGFFLTSLLKENGIEIGLFDTYKNLQLSKIYQNGIYMLFMFKRYLGILPILRLTVYVRDESTKARLEREEERKAYHYLERESSEYNKRKDFFFRAGVLAWENNLKVEYKVYNIERKYGL